MGKHKDQDTLAFIDYLKQKGEQLGFIVDTEYELCEKEYFVDLVWKLQKDKNPLFTFEIETRDHSGIFSNVSKIFGTPSDVVVKPWRHFIIIYKSRLSKGHKNSLSNVLKLHNILLFENVFNEKTERDRLEKALEGCAYDISELIKCQMTGKYFGDAISLVSDGLSKGLNNGLFGKEPEVTISIKAKNPPTGGGRKISILTEMPKGKPSLVDRLKQAKETLTPFTIQAPELKKVLIEGEGESVLAKNPKAQLTFKPDVPILRTRISIPGTCVTFEDVLPKCTKKEGTKVYLSTEDRNLPFVFSFILDAKMKKAGFDFKLDPNRANVKHALQFEDFIRALNANRKVALVNPENNDRIAQLTSHEIVERNEEWYKLYSKLYYIQEKTKQVIPCPSEITMKDGSDIDNVIEAINTGRSQEKIENVSMKINKQGARNMLEFFKKEGRIWNMCLHDEAFANVCGTIIPMGPSKTKFPDMQFALPVEKVEKMINSCPEEETIELTLKPIADNIIIREFQNWNPYKTSSN
jgi:hypothetical protein